MCAVTTLSVSVSPILYLCNKHLCISSVPALNIPESFTISNASASKAAFLRRYGIDDLVEAGRRLWEERAHLGDLEAIRARSRATEAKALLDPTGLGDFTVLEWVCS